MVQPEVDDQPEVAPFEAFYRSQYPEVYAFVLRRLDGSREDVADVTAEVFATAWRRAAQMPPPPEDRLWLYGVARRVVSRHHRVGPGAVTGCSGGCSPRRRSARRSPSWAPK